MRKIELFRLLAVALFSTLLIAGQAYAGNKHKSASVKAMDKSYKECSFVTSAHCGACKSTIENGLNKSAGIMESNVNLDNKVVTVKYNPDKTSADKIRKEIIKLGYKADAVNSDNTGMKKDCCTSGKSAKASNKSCCTKSKSTKSVSK